MDQEISWSVFLFCKIKKQMLNLIKEKLELINRIKEIIKNIEILVII